MTLCLTESIDTRIFISRVSLDVFARDNLTVLGTQIAPGRCFKVLDTLSLGTHQPVHIQLCDHGYEGYLNPGDYLKDVLTPATFTPNRPFNREEIRNAIPDVLAFLFEAMQMPNRYLWGGTIGPNFDCSGLVQAAFASQRIWLPRDAREQFAFPGNKMVTPDKVEPGDLLFFSRQEEIDHVAVHLGNGFYIHSSGPALGRDGIGVDRFSENGGRAAANYYAINRGFRRVCESLVSHM